MTDRRDRFPARQSPSASRREDSGARGNRESPQSAAAIAVPQSLRRSRVRCAIYTRKSFLRRARPPFCARNTRGVAARRPPSFAQLSWATGWRPRRARLGPPPRSACRAMPVRQPGWQPGFAARLLIEASAACRVDVAAGRNRLGRSSGLAL